jgi:predicted transposase/invertase (TIGR01784 family)
LATSEESKTGEIVERIRDRMRHEPDCEKAALIIELTEEILMRRFTERDHEELRRMFKLNDIRESRVWQEAHGEGLEEGLEQGELLEKKSNIKRLQAKGKSLKEIAELLDIPLAEVRRLSR